MMELPKRHSTPLRRGGPVRTHLLPSDVVPARALGESRSGANQRYADRATPDIDGTRSAFGLVGAIAPLIPPHPVRESFYVDGGIFHNTPILKALSEGATSVIAILLSPIGSAMTVNYSAPSNNRGVAILNYYIDVLDRRIFSGEPDATDSETAPTGPAACASSRHKRNQRNHTFVGFCGAALSIRWRRRRLLLADMEVKTACYQYPERWLGHSR